MPARRPAAAPPKPAWIATESDSESTALRLSVSVLEKVLAMVPGGALCAGKTGYYDEINAGFWIGIDSERRAKIHIGVGGWYIKFTGFAWDISVYSGLAEGGHVGMVYRDTDDVDRWVLEAVDSANVPFFSVETGLADTETNVTIGYADKAAIRMVNENIRVDAACIVGFGSAEPLTDGIDSLIFASGDVIMA